MKKMRNSGIDPLGEIPWGTHFCSFYYNKEDLLDILVPYFAAGLASNEYCLWITFDPLPVTDAMAALQKAVPDLPAYLEKGSIEIVSHVDWYLHDGNFVPDKVISGWQEKLNQALEKGYSGMRVNGNEGWLDGDTWKNFMAYEHELNKILAHHHIIVLCTYPLDKCDAMAILDVAQAHECAVAKREGGWQVVEVPEVKLTTAQIRKQNRQLAEQVAERTSRLNALLENTDTAYILLDTSLRILLFNQLAAEYTAQVLSHTAKDGECFSDYITGAKKELFTQLAQSALQGSVLSYVWDHEGQDGTRHFTVKLFPIFQERDSATITGLVFAVSEITQKMLLEAQLAAAREQEQLAITDAVITGEEKARQEMGRELHDNINQVLATAQLYLGLFQQRNPEPAPLLQKTDFLIAEAIKEIRNLSHATISPFIEDASLSQALENLAQIIEKTGAIHVEREFTGLDQDGIPEKCRLTIYRVVQEQFQNILKYAKAKNVWLDVKREGATLTIAVEDDGIGFDTSKKANGIGLQNIKTRISLCSGDMSLVSSPGKGCTLTIHMQIPHQ